MRNVKGKKANKEIRKKTKKRERERLEKVNGDISGRNIDQGFKRAKIRKRKENEYESTFGGGWLMTMAISLFSRDGDFYFE